MFQRFGGSDSTPPKLQTQIYIISGVFGVLMFILILLVLALAVAVARLAKQLKERNGELKYRAVSASGGGKPCVGNATVMRLCNEGRCSGTHYLLKTFFG